MTCEGCNSRPAIGLLTFQDGSVAHLCVKCVPNSPMFHFEIYSHLTQSSKETS